MATTTTNANAQKANMSDAFRQSMAAQIFALDGAKVDRLVAHNDLVGAWQNADPNKAYAGLVPVIGGVERLDLALLKFDLLVENIPSYPKGDDVVFITPADFLHSEARRLAASPTATYQSVFDALVAAFSNGGKVVVTKYPARNKRGGTWQAAIFGIDKAQFLSRFAS